MYNKKLIKLCAVILTVLGTSSAFASLNTNLGNGAIDGTTNKSASINLNQYIIPGVLYEIKCTLNDQSADKMPAIIKLEIADDQSNVTQFCGETSCVNGSQYKLTDRENHTFTSNAVSVYSPSDTRNLVIMWLAGDDVSTPISYQCIATPTSGSALMKS